MLLGAMNNPHRELIKEIEWIVKRFDFVDLTLESPKAHPDSVKTKELKKVLGIKKLVGHTGWYLPVGAPVMDLRMYAVAEFEKCLEVFEKLGVNLANVHFENWEGLNEKASIEANIWTLKKLVSIARNYKIKVMAENTPGLFSSPTVLKHVFEKVPGLMFHLDIAHANIGYVNQTPAILSHLSKKLAHVHISDNSGKGDDHIALGRGNINWPKMLGALKLTGYDGTITLEVFSGRKDLMNSKLKVRQIWDDL